MIAAFRRLTQRREYPTELRLLEQDDRFSGGWPAVLASLKSLLETGDVLSREPWAA